MTSTHRPSSLDGIKRLAKSIKAERGVTHTAALDEAAKHAGFNNYTHAQRRLVATGRISASVPARRDIPLRLEFRGRSAFHIKSRAIWTEAVETLIGRPSATTKIWHGLTEISDALSSILGRNRNHGHLPTGGGLDFHAIRPSLERGCLELDPGSHTYIFRPRLLRLERIAMSPAESFFLLELDALSPSDVYEDEERAERVRSYGSEDLVEVSPGNYVEPSMHDRTDEDARAVVRLFGGQIMFVAKGSLWNGTPDTYSGEHNKLAASEIRYVIERELREFPELADAEDLQH